MARTSCRCTTQPQKADGPPAVCTADPTLLWASEKSLLLGDTVLVQLLF